MTRYMERLLALFDGLSERERHEAATEILRRVAKLEYPPLDDEALTQISSTTFQELDARESAGEGARPRCDLAPG